ncbi:type II secretion system protein [Candidatus Woesebacteria bacterium]|nr:type II secretion system protein [Candidatus Woesebacteria bacterium]
MKTSKGYTLIEVLIVITILGIIMPAVFSILFAILQQQAKISEITEVKRQGDSVLQFMKEKISREATSVLGDNDLSDGVPPYEVCDKLIPEFTSTEEGQDFYFSDGAANFSFYTNDEGLLMFNQDPLTTPLTASPIVISDFKIGCRKKSTYSSPVVAFSFKAVFNRPSQDLQLGTTELFYQSRVRLRTGDSN